MKRIAAIVIAAVAFAGSASISEGVWIVDAESKLTIQGSTNVNTFVCQINYCAGTDTLQYVEHAATRELRFTRSRMTIPVRNFDCGAKPISRDFWRTLNGDQYPNLEINFISLQNPTSRGNIKGIVDITLAGSTARYEICYSASTKPNGDVLLKGMREVNFADFRLVAPEKLKGLIKVNEGLKVEFDLVLKKA